jgi:hypothetical protein
MIEALRGNHRYRQAKMKGVLYRATTSYFCCGLLVHNAHIVDCAPIIRWAVGKPLSDFERWLNTNKGTLELV